MITREFNLYLHAGHSIPLVINVNQYDQGEQWLFTLFNADGTQYIPSSGAIVGIKSDNLGIINSGTVDSQGRVVINETQQMTAAVGKAVFELLIDDQTHGTANFIVLVEPKPGDNADLSESDYSLFQQAIDGTSATAIAEGVADWMDENLTPTSPVVDASLTVQGAAADSAKVGQELSDLKSQISNSMPIDVKHALDTMLLNMVVKDDDVFRDEYNIFHTWAYAVNPPSISAVYTQTRTVYDCDSLDVLRSDLVVTARYDGGSPTVVTAYTLSGELTEGTSTITVNYDGATTTFNVTVEHALYHLAEPFVSNRTNYINTGVALEANKSYSLECTFVIDEFQEAGTGNTVAFIFGDAKGSTTGYSALAENYVSSGGNAGRYLWGCGLAWADSKDIASVAQTIKFLFTMTISSTGFERDWYIKNVTAGTTQNGTQTRTNLDSIKGNNFFIGKQEDSSALVGFNGTLSDFKIFDRILTAEEISAYMGS